MISLRLSLDRISKGNRISVCYLWKLLKVHASIICYYKSGKDIINISIITCCVSYIPIYNIKMLWMECKFLNYFFISVSFYGFI